MKAERTMFRFGDGLIYAFLCALCILLFLLPLLQKQPDSVAADLIVDGEAVETVELSALASSETRIVHGCEILFENSGVRFVSAECPDRLCVRTGEIHLPGESIACVPNRVVVTLRARGTSYDAVAY